MWRSTTGRGRSLHALRRGQALVAVSALLAQIALPSLHAWLVGPDRAFPHAWVDDGTAQLSAEVGQVPAHRAGDCPVCRSLLQVRYFLAPPTLAPAVTPSPQPSEMNLTVSVGSSVSARLPSPRAPPHHA
jgi:hypothetical protein